MLRFFAGFALGAVATVTGTIGSIAFKTSPRFSIDYFTIKAFHPESLSLEGLSSKKRAHAIKMVTEEVFTATVDGDRILLSYPYPKGGLSGDELDHDHDP